MRSKPFRLARIASAVLLASGTLGACRDSSRPRFVATNAHVPDPCALVSGPTSDYVIGVQHGENTTDPSERSADPRTRSMAEASCEWRTPNDTPTSEKGGLIIATVMVELKLPKNYDTRRHPEYLSPSGTRCTRVAAQKASFACWYADREGIVIHIRKGYAEVSISASGTHSAALEKSAYPDTARRLASDAISVL